MVVWVLIVRVSRRRGRGGPLGVLVLIVLRVLMRARWIQRRRRRLRPLSLPLPAFIRHLPWTTGTTVIPARRQWPVEMLLLLLLQVPVRRRSIGEILPVPLLMLRLVVRVPVAWRRR